MSRKRNPMVTAVPDEESTRAVAVEEPPEADADDSHDGAGEAASETETAERTELTVVPEVMPPEAPTAVPMVIHPIIKAILPWASTDQTRSSLCTVLFQPDGRQITCNGHGLAILTPKNRPAAESFPLVNNHVAAGAGESRQRLLATGHIERILRMLPKPREVKTLEMLENAWELTNDADPEAVHLAITDLEQSIVVRIRYQDGQYPDVQRVMPQGTPQLTVGIDPGYLEMVGRSMKAIDAQVVKMTFYPNVKGAMRFDGSGVNGDLTIIVMPKRT